MTDRNSQNPTLSGKQLKAIPLILSARNIREGCKKAHINRDTFYSWMKEPTFKNEFENQRKEIISAALDELRGLAGEAVSVLRGLLKAENETIRFKTAIAIVENVLKTMEIEDLKNRLDEIERRMTP